MPVIHDKFIFTHIQKTGGTSLKLMLQKSLGGLTISKLDHIPLRNIDKFLLESRFKFTIVRNPFARQYSWYQHFLRTRDGQKLPELPFETYFYNRLYKDENFFQQYYLTDYYMFDKVYQTENFDSIVCDLSERLGIKFGTTEYYGKEFNFDRDYRKHYSPKMIDLLIQNERILMENFGYEF